MLFKYKWNILKVSLVNSLFYKGDEAIISLFYNGDEGIISLNKMVSLQRA